MESDNNVYMICINLYKYNLYINILGQVQEDMGIREKYKWRQLT